MDQPTAKLASKKSRKKKGKTVEEVFWEIKNMIYYNLLAPGQKIIYKDIAQRLNVSVTPIVQALKRLELSNLVVYKPNIGYFVGELTEEAVVELYQVREALEIYSLPLVMRNLRKKDLKSIRDAFKQYREATAPDQGRMLMLRDAQFHLKIVEYSGNKTLHAHLKDVLEQIYMKYKPEYLIKDRVKGALQEHNAILNSLTQGDVAKTQGLLRDHIHNGKSHIVHNLRLNQKIFLLEPGSKTPVWIDDQG
ncbi:MAG: GntR family transcriptional regulator [Deltaproteobacteria bacterium]|nr:GntR family transcriptional regulator [Deltaproteobacteria bacterium]